MIELADIRRAAAHLQGRVRRTELIHSPYLSERLGSPLFFKCENLQRTGSFKIRGATWFLACQERARLAAGVITASAGNHAQGVALAATLAGIQATVVMPETTPLAKVLAARDYGARVILRGSTYDEAAAVARTLEQEQGLLNVPAFDHPLIMAAQGSIGLEILEDLPEVDTLLVPIGGGGLIAGISTAIKSLRPATRIIGVEAAQAAAALRSRHAGHRVALPEAHSLADGIALKAVGELTYPVIEQRVDDILTVEEEAIAQAIVTLLEKAKLVTEGAGAVGPAALFSAAPPLHRGTTVCVLSGGNIDVQTLARVVERGLLEEGRYLKLRLELPDVPGALARLTAILGEAGANIFAVRHDRRRSHLPLGRAEVLLELETRGPEHIAAVRRRLAREGYDSDALR
ncbi:L-threonine ammonia-lyase [Geoalkalibacter ferrihydriticus]|uniref:Threonine dehydratase n=2 Tax=Geoalkalibacter ferrihydriticus TaxID=392333 RepID=A0A0C2DW47_9BACT|nr:threonine ammonia-lyase [Geoalkalibacter ferrihydriticus]KIH77644.1 threonine dehydratase [Geoalkalibacter ferrihydriticus DSM 17813]SDL71766.1 L-threonine ammonia-lyase [Geoalkalibacter ferrihydriticus]